MSCTISENFGSSRGPVSCSHPPEFEQCDFRLYIIRSTTISGKCGAEFLIAVHIKQMRSIGPNILITGYYVSSHAISEDEPSREG